MIVASCAVGVRSVVGVSKSLLLRGLRSGRLEDHGKIEEHTLCEAWVYEGPDTFEEERKYNRVSYVDISGKVGGRVPWTQPSGRRYISPYEAYTHRTPVS
jgi:hypothetical protein